MRIIVLETLRYSNKRYHSSSEVKLPSAKKVISNRGAIDCTQRAFRLATFEFDFPLTMRTSLQDYIHGSFDFFL